MEKTYNVIGKTSEELIAKAKELGIETEGLGYNDLQKVISDRLSKETTTTTTVAPTTTTTVAPSNATTPKIKKGGTIKINGNRYGFKRYTPAAFKYEGEAKTQAEWLKDKDAMAAMVADGCVYVEQKI